MSPRLSCVGGEGEYEVLPFFYQKRARGEQKNASPRVETTNAEIAEKDREYKSVLRTERHLQLQKMVPKTIYQIHGVSNLNSGISGPYKVILVLNTMLEPILSQAQESDGWGPSGCGRK